MALGFIRHHHRHHQTGQSATTSTGPHPRPDLLDSSSSASAGRRIIFILMNLPHLQRPDSAPDLVVPLPQISLPNDPGGVARGGAQSSSAGSSRPEPQITPLFPVEEDAAAPFLPLRRRHSPLQQSHSDASSDELGFLPAGCLLRRADERLRASAANLFPPGVPAFMRTKATTPTSNSYRARWTAQPVMPAPLLRGSLTTLMIFFILVAVRQTQTLPRAACSMTYPHPLPHLAQLRPVPAPGLSSFYDLFR